MIPNFRALIGREFEKTSAFERKNKCAIPVRKFRLEAAAGRFEDGFRRETPPNSVEPSPILSKAIFRLESVWIALLSGGDRMNTNHQRVGIALDLLSTGIFPFFERELSAVYADRWEETARSSCRSQASVSADAFHWDAQAILTVMWNSWNSVFQRNLGIIERSLVSELREFRNRWAHQTSFSEDDAYRVLDSVHRLLVACDAAGAADQVEEQKIELLREKLGRRVNSEMARVRFHRARVVDAILYSLCALAICALMVVMWGDRHPMSTGFVVGFTMFVFAYLIFKIFSRTPPAYGVHECEKCRKVVYNEICPYCDPVPRPSQLELSSTGTTMKWPSIIRRSMPGRRRVQGVVKLVLIMIFRNSTFNGPPL